MSGTDDERDENRPWLRLPKLADFFCSDRAAVRKRLLLGTINGYYEALDSEDDEDFDEFAVLPRAEVCANMERDTGEFLLAAIQTLFMASQAGCRSRSALEKRVRALEARVRDLEFPALDRK